jgi:hypothetical protein
LIVEEKGRQVMKRTNLIKRIGGVVLGVSLLFGVAMMSTTSVQAQRGGFHGAGFHGGGHSRVIIGPRVGFGFGRGYYGYPYGYYGYYGYPYGYYSQYVFGDSEAADSQGYHDGLKTGASDARRGQSFDPERSHYFKDAGFGNFAGDYREGFSRGYSDGFHS